MRRPCARLARYVDHFWFSRNATSTATTLLPDGRVDVVLTRSTSGATVGVYGSVTEPAEIALTPGDAYVGVQFRPGAARHVLAVPAQALTDAALPASEALSLSFDRAVDAAEPLETIAALEAALLRHLGNVQPGVERIDHLVEATLASEGQIQVTELVRRFGISRRQVEREFLNAVGLSPKTFASIVRFAHAATRLRRGAPIVEAAMDSGFADQSHLHREFRRFSGITPAAYARGQVAFLQDSKAPAAEDCAV